MPNTIVLTGNLTDSPKSYQTNNGLVIVNFTIACRNAFKGQGEQDYGSTFFRCKAFGTTAQYVQKFFGKGDLVQVTGAMQEVITQYNGQTYKNMEITCSQANRLFQAQSNRQAQAQPQYNYSQPVQQYNNYSQPVQQAQPVQQVQNELPQDIANKYEISDEDLPF